MSLLSAFQSSLSVHKVWGLNCRVCHNKPLQAGRLKQDTCLRTVLEHRSRQWRFEETRTCWEIRGVSPLPFPLGVPRSPATNGLLQSLLSVTLSASTLTHLCVPDLKGCLQWLQDRLGNPEGSYVNPNYASPKNDSFKEATI